MFGNEGRKLRCNSDRLSSREAGSELDSFFTFPPSSNLQTKLSLVHVLFYSS